MLKLLFTGSNGFLGRNILPLLDKNDYSINTLDISNADININLAQEIPQLSQSYDVIFHAVGKAHFIPKNNIEAKIFFDVNLQGTQNLCAGLEKTGLPRSFIFISTVAVYGCEIGENINENYPLNGNSPYAQSKIQTEEFLINWAKTNNVILTILRPSLIAGRNPPGNLGAMINGIKTGKYLSIGGGKAQKSVVWAGDLAVLISKAALHGGIYNVCDDHHPNFAELEKLIAQQLNRPFPKSIPYSIATFIAKIGDILGSKAPINSGKLLKITKSLTFSNEKARKQLDWQPADVLSNFKIS
jgi:nucleoside-diphosphate-sugar epimerase